MSAIADAVGFRYRFDPPTGQYAHATAIFVLTPDGRVSRTLEGIRYAPDALRAALDGAADGEAGRSLQQVLIQCFCYTPALRRWAGGVALFLRSGAVAILLGLVGVVVFAVRRHRRRQPARGRGRRHEPVHSRPRRSPHRRRRRRRPAGVAALRRPRADQERPPLAAQPAGAGDGDGAAHRRPAVRPGRLHGVSRA